MSEVRGGYGGAIDRFFALRASGTTVRTELAAGLTTFLTMAYIVAVNPAILGDAGMDKGAVFVATCLAAALGSAIMGLAANYPVALAPGMGLNAYFAYVIVGQQHFTWQAALGAMFLSGLGFLLLTLVGLREKLVAGIPASLRVGITAGIGFFLAFIALKSAGLVVADPATLVTLGDLHRGPALLALLGFLVIATLAARRVTGALVLGIALVTALGPLTLGTKATGLLATPPSLAPTLLALDLRGALSHGLAEIVLVLFLVELLDATGTLVGVAGEAGLLAIEGADRRLGRALFADSLAIVAGALLGTSSTTAYLESAAGVAADGRTGLTALTVAALFLLTLVFAPLVMAVPSCATAPALFFVACLMMRGLRALPFDDLTEAVPALITAIAMPLTFSIANGIAFGLIAHVAIKLATGRVRNVSLASAILAALFVLRYAVIAR